MKQTSPAAAAALSVLQGVLVGKLVVNAHYFLVELQQVIRDGSQGVGLVLGVHKSAVRNEHSICQLHPYYYCPVTNETFLTQS